MAFATDGVTLSAGSATFKVAARTWDGLQFLEHCGLAAGLPRELQPLGSGPHHVERQPRIIGTHHVKIARLTKLNDGRAEMARPRLPPGATTNRHLWPPFVAAPRPGRTRGVGCCLRQTQLAQTSHERYTRVTFDGHRWMHACAAASCRSGQAFKGDQVTRLRHAVVRLARGQKHPTILVL